MKESSASVFEFMVQETSAHGKFRVRDSGVECREGAVLHAVDSHGRASLLVPLASLKEGQLDWHSRALSLQFKELDVDGSLTPFLLLQCLDPRLRTQFGLLSDDVLEGIEQNPAAGLQVATSTVDRWRRLFESGSGGLLGPSQLAGIFAELLVLEQLVETHGPTALVAWQGPSGNRHDYVFDGLSLEVKATTNHNNMVVTIHGGKQLLAPQGSDLYLMAFQLERNPTGLSVPDKVHNLIEKGVSRFDLLTLLDGPGYRDSDSDAYSNIRFTPLQDKTFLVDAAFPRITPETIHPTGMIEKIANISYSVDLGQLESTEIDTRSLVMPSSGVPKC